jgi:hypothetical protein
MKSLIALEGIATPHQGLWQIESYEDHFAITTKEALTVGAFKWHDEIQEQIDTFGLELRPHSKGLKGYSHFDVLEEGCLRDAIERLYWLESCCWIINRMVAKSTQTAWNEAIEKALSKTPIPADPDEVVNPIGAIAFMQPRELWDNFA